MLGDAGGLTPASRDELVRRDVARPRAGRSDADKAVRAARSIRRQELFRIAVADLSGSLDLAGVGAALTDLTAALVETALQVATPGRRGRSTDRCRPGCWWSAWAGSAAARWATASDADVLFVHEPIDGRRRGEPPRSRRWRPCRSCAGCSRRPGRTRSSAWTPTCGPRARRAARAQPGELPRLLRALVAHLGVAGPAARDAAGGRRRARRAVHRADRPAALAAGRAHRPAGARDPDAQGAGGGRAAAPRRRPQEPLQARAVAGWPTSSGPCSCSSCGTPTLSRRCGRRARCPRWTRRSRPGLSARSTPRHCAMRGRSRRVCATPPCSTGAGLSTACPRTCGWPTASAASSAESPAAAPTSPRPTDAQPAMREPSRSPTFTVPFRGR